MKVSIIGAGFVGSSFAYRLLVSKIANEIVLVDANVDRARAEVAELNHTLAVENRTHVLSGSLQDTKDSDFIVITAGSNQKPGQTRLDLFQNNLNIFKEIVPVLAGLNPKAVFLVATNPMDVLTYATWKLSGLPSNQVIGSGTVLDSSRFRYYLGQHLKSNPRDIFAHVLGEHGDSQVEIFSNISIKGLTLEYYCKQFNIDFNKENKESIVKQTRDAAYSIISGKGATYFGITSCLMRIIEGMARDENVIMPVCSLLEGEYGIDQVYLSVPTILNRQGSSTKLVLDLTSEELQMLQKSAEVVQSFYQYI
jgi:L-lactate dehydrogenase